MKRAIGPLIALTAIMLVGFFLRFHQLNAQSYWMDEGYTINAIISGMTNGMDASFSNILDSGAKYSCPTYCLPTMAMVTALGNSPFAYRLLAAICGVLLILLIWAFTRSISRNISPPLPLSTALPLIAAAFTALSYFQIAWSRQARWYTELELFYWASLFCFYLFLRAKDPPPAPPLAGRGGKFSFIFLALSIVFALLAVITQPIAYTLPVVMFAWYAMEHPRVSKLVLPLNVVVITLILVQFIFGSDFFVFMIRNFAPRDNAPYYVDFYFIHYWLLIALSAYGIIRSPQKRSLIALSLPLLLTFISLSFFTNTIEYRYAFITTPALFIIAAIGTGHLTNDIRRHLETRTTWSTQWVQCLSISMFAVVPAIFIISGEGIMLPKPFYALESDDFRQSGYHAYTPQPDFTAAYDAIKRDLRPEDAIVSSHPQFNKIFLNRPGYWMAFDYLGRNIPVPPEQKTEMYVNAEVLHDLGELQALVSSTHGYVVYDYQSMDGRIDPEIIRYVKETMTLTFEDAKNEYSRIWVYRF